VGIVMDENASLQRLESFPVIYLPNAAILSPSETERLGDYVSRGGNLLLTGLTGTCDRQGNLQDRSALEPLIGARLVRCGTEHPDNYVRLPGELASGEAQFLLEAVRPDWPMLTWGPIAVYQPTSARAFGELMVAHRTRDNLWAWRMSPGSVAGPAVLVHRHGKGKVVTVACAIDAAFAGDYRMPEHRKLLGTIVRYLNPSPPVVVQAPVNVEILVTRDRQRRRRLVHFLSFSGPPTGAAAAFPQGSRVLPALMEKETPYEASVEVTRPFRGADLFGSDNAVSVSGNRINLKASRCHEVLIIQDY
jgi:hypothetical protein